MEKKEVIVTVRLNREEVGALDQLTLESTAVLR